MNSRECDNFLTKLLSRKNSNYKVKNTLTLELDLINPKVSILKIYLKSGIGIITRL